MSRRWTASSSWSRALSGLPPGATASGGFGTVSMTVTDDPDMTAAELALGVLDGEDRAAATLFIPA